MFVIQCVSCNTRFNINRDQFTPEDVKKIFEQCPQAELKPTTPTPRPVKPPKIVEKPRTKPIHGKQSPTKKVPSVNLPKATVKIKSLTERNTLATFKKQLKKVIPNYKQRPEQIRLARTIARILEKDSILVAEAGVGTGKSMGYLVPTLHHVINNDLINIRPIVISTKTIALQEQLIGKDIPTIQKLIEFEYIDAILTKGQTNFVCAKKTNQNSKSIKAKLSLNEYQEITTWSMSPPVYGGDKSDSPVRISEDVWKLMNVESCEPDECVYGNKCFFAGYRRSRQVHRGLIVTNHNQLVADFVLREKWGRGLWPEPCLYIIDEAHNLENSVRSELAQEISTSRIYKLQRSCRKIRLLQDKVDPEIYHHIDDALDKFISIAEGVYQATQEWEESEVHIPNSPELIENGNNLMKALQELRKKIDFAYSGINTFNQKEERKLDRVLNSVQAIESKLFAWLKRPDDYYLSCKLKDNNLIITLNPLNIGQFLKHNLWYKNIPVVLTSGTLSSNGSFGPIKEKLGLTSCHEFMSSTNLTPSENVAFYIAEDLPRPKSDEEEDNAFTLACAERIAELIKCSGGHALVLFTSHRRLNDVYNIIRKRPDIPWRVLHQRDRDATQIFRDDKSSVLMATGAFWEGIDVNGDSLTMVIMDKLPFPSPLGAYIAAKEKELEKQGKSRTEIFEELYLPEMLLQLKQGAGRLLRGELDWGAIAILDPRAAGDKYRDLVLKCIPPHTKVNSVKELLLWFNNRVNVGITDGSGQIETNTGTDGFIDR